MVLPLAPPTDPDITQDPNDITPVVGSPVQLHKLYTTEGISRKFWRVSFKPSKRFASSSDAMGRPILWQHPREEPDSYSRRKQAAKGPNFVGPIVRQYNDFAFRKEAMRDGGDTAPEYKALLEDADGHGCPLPHFMRKALRKAQVDGLCYIMPINPVPDGLQITTLAEREMYGAKPYLRLVSADNLINWIKRDGHLFEGNLMLEIDGQRILRHLTETTREDFTLEPLNYDLGKNQAAYDGNTDVTSYRVVKSRGVVTHGYKGIPLVPLEPNFDDIQEDEDRESQVSPIAELQQLFWNLLSWGIEELWNSAFTMFFVSGAPKPTGDDKSQEVLFGTNKCMWFTNPAAKLNRIAGDPVAFESLQHAKDECRSALFTVAGLQSADPTKARQGVESGIALAFKFQNLAAQLSALVDGCEKTENRLWVMLADAWKFKEPTPTKYPDNFDIPDYGSELQGVVQAAAGTGLPSTFIKAIMDRFTSRNLNLTDEEQDALDDEMENRAQAKESMVGMRPPPKPGADPLNPGGAPADPKKAVDPTDPRTIAPASPTKPKVTAPV